MNLLVVLAAVLVPALSTKLPYIVGGRDATPGKYPWQGSLQMYGSYHICGASLISRRWLVCAAHCVGSSASSYSIVLGAHDIKTQRQGQPRRYQVSRIVSHPSYNPNSAYANDISLIYLSQDADTSNRYISTIAVGNKGENFVGNRNCYITGWGADNSGGSPNNLQELNVDVWSSSQCKQYVNGAGPYHVCIAKYGGSACNGDSGGPLACNQGGQWKLLGAASFVYKSGGKCLTYYPSVYANVPHFRDWIRSTTGV